MAIEVIKRGTPPAEIVYWARCKTCTSELTYLLSDTTAHADDRPGGECIRSIKCSVCQERVNVPYTGGIVYRPVEAKPRNDAYNCRDGRCECGYCPEEKY